MNEKETKKLKAEIKELLKDDFDKFDFKSHIDKSLNIDENRALLVEKLRHISFKQKNLKQEIRMIEEKTEYELFKALKEQENMAEQEFLASVSNIQEIDSCIVDNAFSTLNNYVKMICNGNINGLIVEGETGLGKSYNILKTLKQEQKDFVYSTGYSTILELYHFLYQNKDKIIFFDDTKNIFGTRASMELLKACLFSSTGKRLVKYCSTSNKLKVPSQFIFNGRLIIAVNILDSIVEEDLKAIMDRVYYYKVDFSYQDRLRILAELVKLPYKELTLKDRQFVFEFVKFNTNQATENLNFRLLSKLYEVYRFDKANFSKLSKAIIRANEEKELLLMALEGSNSIKEAQIKWCEETGKGRATFFRLKKKVYDTFEVNDTFDDTNLCQNTGDIRQID